MNEITLGVISLFVLIGLTAFFVFAEYSLVTSRKTRIAEMAENGNSNARIVERVMRDPDRFFAATQLGITFTSLAIGVISEPAISDTIAHYLEQLGLPINTALLHIIGVALGLIVASYFQIVLAELVPRSVTLRNAENIALTVVPIMNGVANVFAPFIALLKGSARLVTRLFGINQDAPSEASHSVEELKILLEASEKGGVIEPEEKDMLEGVFSFGDTTVREIMVPRTEITAISVDAPLSEVIHTFAAHTFSRLPVYEESPDNVIGILHGKDMMRALYPTQHTFSIRSLMREAKYVPDTQRADEVLQQMRTQSESMLIVLDEYGGTAGLVTMNDLIAVILGEVGVTNNQTPDIHTQADGSIQINGLTTIGDFNDEFDVKLVDPNYDTIGGWVMGKLKRIPKVGDHVRIESDNPNLHGAKLIVEEMDRLRVAKLKLVRA